MKEKIKFIKDLAKSLNTYELDSVEYKNEYFKVEIKKKIKDIVVQQQNVVTYQSKEVTLSPQKMVSVEPDADIIEGTKIESPMVGTYYSAPSPDAKPFAKEGDVVKEGQVLCIIEAMKLMNEVKSSSSGTVKKAFIKNGEQVKKAQVLFIIN